MILTGIWTGQYTYGDDYPDSGKSVPFELDIRSMGVEFHGFAIEEESKQIFDEPVMVYGYLENDQIGFSKIYPSSWYINEEGKPIALKDVPSHEVFYTGTMTDNGFAGEWEVKIHYAEPDENGHTIETEGRGTWSMERKKGL